MSRIRVEAGDSRDVLKTLADDSVDACVTDPPYHLVSIYKRFAKTGGADRPESRVGAYTRHARGFMGKTWDGGDLAHDPAFWAEVWRVLKPGAHLVAFGGTRTYHRLACAIEDAGFEIRDQIGWAFGSGFPKSHNIGKAIDRAAGVQGTYGAPKSAAHAGWVERGRMRGGQGEEGWQRPWMDDPAEVEKAARQYHPATAEAIAWKGWGTALKPAWEPICLARKPLSEETIAANVLRHGSGALNIDACRVGYSSDADRTAAFPGGRQTSHATGSLAGPRAAQEVERVEFTAERPQVGRWPANFCHDGSDEVLAEFPESGKQNGAATQREGEPSRDRRYGENGIGFQALPGARRSDDGSAARFFYCAKAGADDRCGSKHPTVKPVALMRWLVRLVCPPGGLVLDPFAGSGTTAIACIRESMGGLLIEREAEYVADIERRLAHLGGAGMPLFASAP